MHLIQGLSTNQTPQDSLVRAAGNGVHNRSMSPSHIQPLVNGEIAICAGVIPAGALQRESAKHLYPVMR